MSENVDALVGALCLKSLSLENGIVMAPMNGLMSGVEAANEALGPKRPPPARHAFSHVCSISLSLPLMRRARPDRLTW